MPFYSTYHNSQLDVIIDNCSFTRFLSVLPTECRLLIGGDHVCFALYAWHLANSTHSKTIFEWTNDPTSINIYILKHIANCHSWRSVSYCYGGWCFQWWDRVVGERGSFWDPSSLSHLGKARPPHHRDCSCLFQDIKWKILAVPLSCFCSSKQWVPFPVILSPCSFSIVMPLAAFHHFPDAIPSFLLPSQKY